MKIVLASHNQKKMLEMRRILSESGMDIEVLTLDDIGYFGDIEETGTTFEENSLIKASVPAKLGYIGIADDSGLCVDYLSGAPGVYSARYSGPDATDEKNNDKLLFEMRNAKDTERTARYVTVITLCFPDDRKPLVFSGTCEGKILSSRHGDGGFGYDPLFWVPEYNKTFAEVGIECKNKISHRAKAMRAFCEAFAKLIKDDCLEKIYDK
ncbi:MAG: XTP/dITP diphosphatase [Clostridia bacterium]|nr:XTP/dITP diphosphatase [Clostridia bacterium]